MTKEQIIKIIQEKIQEKLGNEYIVDCVKMIQNNDVILHAVNIHKKDQTVGLFYYLPDNLKECDIEVYVNEVIEIYFENKKNKSFKEFLDFSNIYEDFNKIQEYLNLRILNLNMNKERLKNIPYRIFLNDLAVIPIIEAKKGDTYVSSIIGPNLLEVWNKDFATVFEEAEKHFYMQETHIINLHEVIEVPTEEVEIPMYILTNSDKMYGAARIWDENKLQEFAAEMFADIIAIPSSIHEWILVLCDVGKGQEMIEDAGWCEMIQSANVDVVKFDDILSNHAYLYTLKNGWEVDEIDG